MVLSCLLSPVASDMQDLHVCAESGTPDAPSRSATPVHYPNPLRMTG